ncbi:DUF1549 domain-containing protein [Thalassoglobus polymorphus]|uniref:Planctomycete cytochrome C n=1 Tax=Thalassoglobus polymorphus TaxID=2527994 RepID=A0A517QND7_9PLAN|nr:DUF1549 domain-containing protein [Thalassoglobus polymorphus]QDT33142.1 Planctomycete cytochrome C [Thalassoglobus polymorphus]
MKFPAAYLPPASLLIIVSIFATNAHAEQPDAQQANVQKANSAGIEFFESKIRPLLIDRCADCHGADLQEAELRLDTPGHLLAGGQSGPIVVAGKPDQSLLITAVGFKDEALQMPPDDKLTDAEIALLTKWVEMGAPAPNAELIASKQRIPFDVDEARKHWSFQELKRPAVPEIEGLSNPIDQFIYAKLEEKRLIPAPPATKRVLIRRAYLDLIGLPPTPEQIQAFLEDETPEAFNKVVEDLLASPHYGERWGRHWLDVARYADSNGLDENIAHGNAWRYRDYVIESFNSDKPYDQFVKEQLAGDLLEGPEETRYERLIATGFLSLGPKVLAEADQTKMLMDIIDEQVDTTGRAFLGLTLGCARCHDHKFDPIRADDYYALAGIFKSTYTMESLKTIAKWNEHVIATPEELEAKKKHDAQVASIQSQLDELKKKQTANSTASAAKPVVKVDATGEKVVEQPAAEKPEAEPSLAEQIKSLDKELKALKAKAPPLSTTMGVKEAEPEDIPIHVRGSHRSLGRVVDRGVPLVLAKHDPGLKNPKQSGRLELANWMASSENPLTSRVWVNRVWRWHFGEGLSTSVDNFGFLGQEPSHPKLLDWLATEFIAKGWSTKELHRLIMSSKTYQMAAEHNAHNSTIDPANTYLSRANTQRMEAEIFRDSLLFVSAQLDTTMGGSLLHVKNREFIFNHTSKDNTNYDTTRRSIYLPVIRNNLYAPFSLFDYTDASVLNGDRETSTVAPQALYALNSDLVITASEKLAERLLQQESDNPEQRVNVLFETTYGRTPTDSEISAVLEYVQQLQTQKKQSEQLSWTALCQIFLISNEFIYVE